MKKKLIYLSIVILLTTGTVFYLKFNATNRSQPKPGPIAVDTNTQFHLTGILREIYLDDETKNTVMLEKATFQLTQLNKSDLKQLPLNATSIYLESFPGNLYDSVGKCVEVKGKLKADWFDKVGAQLQKNERFSFRGLAFDAEEINKVDFSLCDGYSALETPENVATKVFTGSIEHMERNIPETGPYDYVLIYTKDTVDESTTSPVSKMAVLPLIPANNEIWMKLEKYIGKQKAIEVYPVKAPVNYPINYYVVTQVQEETKK